MHLKGSEYLFQYECVRVMDKQHWEYVIEAFTARTNVLCALCCRAVWINKLKINRLMCSRWYLDEFICCRLCIFLKAKKKCLL